MGLFKPARLDSAFAKIALMGAAGSGKTFTTSQIAIGIVRLAKERKLDYAQKPVFFLDSENGSDYVVDVFEEAGIPLLVAKTRSFSDLTTAMREAQVDASVLMIDSVTHFWDEWRSSFAKKKNRSSGLRFEDQAELKQQWREKFADLFVNARLHTLICGRLGFEWENSIDAETGKKSLEKVGVKLAAEKELGHEASLLILMERETDPKTLKTVRTATILKDRFRKLDGKELSNPTYKSFASHIEALNIGGQQTGIDLTRNSMAEVPDDQRRDKYPVQIEICAEEIQGLLVKHHPGRTASEQQTKGELLFQHFGTRSWAQIEKDTPLMTLRAGYDSLHRALENRPSRYAENPHIDMDQEQDALDAILSRPSGASASNGSPEASVADAFSKAMQ